MESIKEYEAMVKGPGKFEGEARYVPYYWDMYLNGWADDDDGEVLTFYPDDDDRKLFPELEHYTQVCLIEDSQGFVTEV